MQYFFITGSSSGLGKALAEQCLAAGHNVVGVSRNQNIYHKNYTHISADLSDQKTLHSFEFPYINAAKNASRIVLINNAATVQPVKYAGRATSADIISAYTLNIIAPAVLNNLFINTFAIYTAEKIVVNISSGAANYPVDGWSVYCSSKAAVDMYTKVAAMEQEKENLGFRVVSIAPGIVDTAMQTQIRQAETEDFSRVREFKEYKSGNQLTSPEEAARKIISAIEKIKHNSHVVFSVKN